MKTDNQLKKVEFLCRKDRVMENHYGVQSFNNGDPYFTDSQETDIKEMISDGLTLDEIIAIIKKW